MDIGGNIRQIRIGCGLTQQQLADRCGLSKGMISKVENGVAVPAVGTLARIASVLNVKVSSLLDANTNKSANMTINPFADETKFIQTVKGYKIFNPIPGYAQKQAQPVMILAENGTVKRHLVSHKGEEYIFIVEGEMLFRVDKDTYLLRQGDSLYFNARLKHGIESVPQKVKYVDMFIGADATHQCEYNGEYTSPVSDRDPEAE